MICPKCGAALQDTAKFCVVCGAELTSEPAEAVASEVRQEIPAAPQSAECPKCGAPRQGTESFCLFCGAPLDAPAEAPAPQHASMPEQPAPQPMETPAIPRPSMTAPTFKQPAAAVQPNYGAAPANLKEFVTLYGDEPTKKSMKSAGIFIYVLAAFNVVAALISGSFPLDALVLAGLGFWYQKTYSPKCGMVLLGYAILSVVLSLLMYGRLQGWVVIIVAVMVFSSTQKAQKEFNSYQNQQQPPMR